ncbi:hypothetical protein [Endozoicomonas sp. SCSIO W0465]|uniref:hypothetical protein n=1 Tax=Endozoicomonas sp. SCSIO W0465 TaxID=2918516 RepID=UPI00207633E2|nr:hypothetical protein [Endozoicomonas sp. SCSIO W0465]USE37041.1 hypothetical protein MJO57_02045 [Endozoicomonas sp. SCSIO W0465]
MIYNAFRKLLAKYCQALPQEDSSLIYEISSLQYEKSHNKIYGKIYNEYFIWHESAKGVKEVISQKVLEAG